MGALPRPDIPPGPQRDLVAALHGLHHRAGWPSLRTLAREAGCSHTTVSNVFTTPRLPSWGVLELLVEAMDGDTTEFHELWLACGDPTTVTRTAPERIAGRRDELAAVRRHLESGTGLLLVTGEAGIGKTKLVMTAAAGVDAFVAKGSCRPLSTDVPLLPVAELLRTVLLADPTWFKAALVSCPAYVPVALGAILPELDTHEASSVSDEWARQRLFNAVAALLVALQEEQPLGLLVEDAHWADATTLDVIELIGSHHAIPLVVTVRTDDPDVSEAFAPWLTRGRRLPNAEELALAPLTLAETAQQVALLGHGEPDPAEVARIHARSLGQPLFTEQLALHPDDVPLPDLLADVLLRRLRGLGAEGWSVARALGVADRPLLAGQLAEITALDPVPGLRELDAQRLLARADGPEVRLRHPLVGDAIRTRLVPGEAPGVHRQVAMVLAAAPDPPAAEIADHWAAAGDDREELRWRIEAARAASARFAVESAARQWQRLVELWPEDLDEAGDPPLTRAGMYGAALRAIPVLDYAAAIPLLDPALAVAESAAAAPEEAAAILHRIGSIRGRSADPDAALALCERAVALYADLPPCRDQVEALLHLQACQESSGHFREAVEIGDRIVAAARRLGAPSLLKEALAQVMWHRSVAGDSGAAQDALTELTAIVLDPPDPYCEIEVAACVTDVLLMRGAPTREVLEAAESALAAADRWGLHQWDDAIVRANVTEALIAHGDIEPAWKIVAPYTEGDPAQERWPLHVLRAQLELLGGRAELAERQLAAVAAGPPGGLAYRLFLAITAGSIDLWTRRPAAALDRALSVLEEGHRSEEPVMLAPLLALAARAAADLHAPGRGEQLSDLHRRLTGDPFASHALLVSPAAYGATWAAELARLEGRDTVEGWVAAAAAWDRLTRPFDSAYCRWRAAQVALQADQGTGAAKLLRRAARDARGHEPLREAIRRCGYPAGRG